MIKIYTPLRDGEMLLPEILKGIAEQTKECCLIPITSTGKEEKSSSENSRKNRVKNILRALKINKENYFLMMDSDVVLGHNKIIEEMFENKLNFKRDIIAVTTKREDIKNCPYIPHSLILIKRSLVKKLKLFLENYKNYKNCPICEFVKKYINDVISLENKRLYEK